MPSTSIPAANRSNRLALTRSTWCCGSRRRPRAAAQAVNAASRKPASAGGNNAPHPAPEAMPCRKMTVSAPSRATATAATAAMPQVPRCSAARFSAPSISRRRPRAWRRIHSTMCVISAAATRISTAWKISWPRSDRLPSAPCIIAESASAKATPAATPDHRPTRTLLPRPSAQAARMPITNMASRLSRQTMMKALKSMESNPVQRATMRPWAVSGWNSPKKR